MLAWASPTDTTVYLGDAVSFSADCSAAGGTVIFAVIRDVNGNGTYEPATDEVKQTLMIVDDSIIDENVTDAVLTGTVTNNTGTSPVSQVFAVTSAGP